MSGLFYYKNYKPIGDEDMTQEILDIKYEPQSGGGAIIGDLEDAALLFTEIDGKLIIVKEKSIHEFYFPQKKIDPPNVQQPLLKFGSNSEVVSRTFLTAVLIFDKQYIAETVDINGILKFSFKVVQDLLELEEAINRYDADYQNAIRVAASRTSFTLPHIENLESRCKTVMQKAHHISRTLRIIVKTILDGYILDGEKIKSFDDVAKLMLRAYGNDHNWGQFLSERAPFMQIVEDIRNGLDHDVGSVTIQDFMIGTDGKIAPPTIKSRHGTHKLKRMDIRAFLRTLRSNLITVAEAVIAGSASGQVKEGYPNYNVCDIPDGERRFEFVRYAICSETPFGPFFHQK